MVTKIFAYISLIYPEAPCGRICINFARWVPSPT